MRVTALDGISPPFAAFDGRDETDMNIPENLRSQACVAFRVVRERMDTIMNRRRSLTTAVALACVFLAAFSAVAGASPDKKDKTVGRLLLGKVLDQNDNPVPDAVVYLTNTRTRAIKTYIVGKDGTYRFPALSTAVDYEVYAQFKSRKSDPKSVSQFDERSQVYLDLHVDTR